jgi:TolB-like protein
MVKIPQPTTLLERLSTRQREILELIAKGLTNEDIGGVLSISPATVRTHMTALLAKLDVTNRTEAAALFLAAEASPSRVDEVLRRPAIAVLPFIVLDKSEQGSTIARALAHDLATLFARWCWFPVIASESANSARISGSTSQDIGQRLGARFLVDGTLQGGTSSFRLTVRIDDVETGYCLWTEQYEFPRNEMFEVQDAVCEAIVAAAYPVLIVRVQVGLRQAARPSDLAAWELAHHGMQLYSAREEATNRAAQERFQSAIERAPDLVLAYYGYGLASYDQVLNQWSKPDEGRVRLLSCAERCLALAPHAAEGHYLLARYHQTLSDHLKSVHELEIAIARNPSFATAHALLAQALQLYGRSDDALLRMKHALRLSPRAFVAGLGFLHFMRGEYQLALDTSERAIDSNPNYPFAYVIASVSAWYLGEVVRANEHIQTLRTKNPRFTPMDFRRVFGSQFDEVERIAKTLEQITSRR